MMLLINIPLFIIGIIIFGKMFGIKTLWGIFALSFFIDLFASERFTGALFLKDFIFKVNDIKKHGAPQIIKQYHVRHILIKVNEITGDEEAHQKILGIRNTIMQDTGNPAKESADFVRLAKQYSEDTSSINGGDIGWVSKGDTVPAFEQTMINTPVGVVSQPIHSPFGWHILQVLGTRESNLSNDREKAEIRQEIHDNKANTLYNQWMRDIRDSAYVQMNDN